MRGELEIYRVWLGERMERKQVKQDDFLQHETQICKSISTEVSTLILMHISTTTRFCLIRTAHLHTTQIRHAFVSSLDKFAKELYIDPEKLITDGRSNRELRANPEPRLRSKAKACSCSGSSSLKHAQIPNG